MQGCCCLMPVSLSEQRSLSHIVARPVVNSNKKSNDLFNPQGWEKLTDAVIHWINDHNSNVVFLLWGTDAQKKASFINEVCTSIECFTMWHMTFLLYQARHLVLKTVHPSPLSVYRGFFGCKHFSQANQYLVRHGRVPVDWSHLPG